MNRRGKLRLRPARARRPPQKRILAKAAGHKYNKCIRDLMGDIHVHRKKKSNLTFLTMEEEQMEEGTTDAA